MNRLILGDNLEIMRSMQAQSVDLIYLDPPFFSNRNYEVIWGDSGEVRSFQDRWAGGISHYIGWLKERVEEMHRLLKPTGSIFLHCDWHANAYIRVDILDKIFGYENFRNEIIWKRTNAHNDVKKRFGNISDNIFFYSKSPQYIFDTQYEAHGEKYLTDFYKYKDENGRVYQLDNMSAPAGGGMSAIVPDTGKPRGWYEYKGYQPPEKGWRYELATMKRLDEEGRLHFPEDKNGRIRLKRYLDEQKGMILGDVWTDINNVQGAKRIGYPTQKPEALLERIIKCASHEGDVVLDPFVGGGTTIVVADKLGRQWIGIDQSVQAVKVTEFRLNKQQDLFSKPFSVQLYKYDYDTLRYKDAFAFETWIVQQVGGTSNTKQRSDLGLDGKATDGTPIQVKRSDNIGRNVIDNFVAAVMRFDKKLYDKQIAAKKAVGTIIAFSFGKGAVEEVARLKNKEGVIIILKTVEEIVPIAKKPTITLHLNEIGKDAKGVWEIELIAKAESAAGIEFYAWDFAHNAEKGFKPTILIDKEGRQTHKFKSGIHIIAVKAVDNDGLDSVEILRLKVNGQVVKESKS